MHTHPRFGSILYRIGTWRTLNEMSNFMSTGQMGNFIFCPACEMLYHWLANVELKSQPRQLLAETLLNLGYTRLAEFLTTEADPDLFM